VIILFPMILLLVDAFNDFRMNVISRNYNYWTKSFPPTEIWQFPHSEYHNVYLISVADSSSLQFHMLPAIFDIWHETTLIIITFPNFIVIIIDMRCAVFLLSKLTYYI
jgi:hypothetical protein